MASLTDKVTQVPDILSLITTDSQATQGWECQLGCLIQECQPVCLIQECPMECRLAILLIITIRLVDIHLWTTIPGILIKCLICLHITECRCIPVTIILTNNGALKQIRWTQWWGCHHMETPTILRTTLPTTLNLSSEDVRIAIHNHSNILKVPIKSISTRRNQNPNLTTFRHQIDHSNKPKIRNLTTTLSNHSDRCHRT